MRELYRVIRHGRWSCGWNTRKSWPRKPYLFAGRMYLDAVWHYVLHLGPLWIEVQY